MNFSLIVGVVIVAALAFDFTNGFHDTANAMATSIATGALKPRVAVAISAVLNLVGAFLSIQVAKTISGGIVDDTKVTPVVIFAGLVGAIIWNLLTWILGLPSSSSHALFGGLIGATWIASGADAVHFGQVVQKVLIPAVASPLVAGVVAMAGTFLVYRITESARQDVVSRSFKTAQALSASLVSLAHGTNDAQKTMGVVTLTLIASGSLAAGSGPPLWVILSSGVAIAAGTYFGGWRIINTMGKRITEIETPQGFAAETSAAVTILASSHLGFALSTTHVCSGGIVGSGVGRKLAEVRWGVAGQMVIAWVLTLPAAAVVGAGAAEVAREGAFGTLSIGVFLIAIALGVFLWSRRNPVTPDTVTAAAEPIPATV